LVVLTALFIVFIAFTGWIRPYNLRTEQAAARAAGIPLTPAEFSQVEPPANQNAVSTYLELGKLLDAHRADETKIWTSPSDGTGVVPKANTEALKHLVASRSDISRVVHAAVAKPHVFVRHDGDSVELYRYLAPMREAAVWIRRESLMLSREGQPVEAVRHQALGFRVANQASEVPNLIACLVGLASEDMTLKGLENILSEAGPNAVVADAVRREIATYHPRYDLARCLKGEILLGLTEVHQVSSLHDYNVVVSPDETFKPSGRKPSGLFKWYFMDPAEAIYLHWMTERIKVSQEPIPDRLRDLARLGREFEKTPDKMPTYKLAKMMLPIFSGADEREVDLAARRAAVVAMADVMAYRARHGRWPVSLGQTGSPAPLDPRTGKPVGYRKDGKGFVVFTTPNPVVAENLSPERAGLNAEIHYPPLKPKPRKMPRMPIPTPS
jgi:hypothetical protein